MGLVVVNVGVFMFQHHIRRVEAPNSKQDFQRDVAPDGLNDPYPVQMLADPFLNDLDMHRTDEIDFVEHNQVSKTDLTYLEH